MTQRAKNSQAVLAAWAWDWEAPRTKPAPTANQLVRALCTNIHNLPMNPAGVFGYYGSNGLDLMLRFHARDHQRPAQITVTANGASMVSAAGYEMVPGLERARALWARFARFAHYMRDVRHNWEYIGRVNYADNSTEDEYQSALTGEIRRVMVTGPHGDACF